MQAVSRRKVLSALAATGAGAVICPIFGRAETPALAVGQQAPDFVGISSWLNSPPLRMGDLRGKVVLVDFWSYSCINCIRTFPYLNRWFSTYRDQGFTIVGVHTPEFKLEREPANVSAAVERFGIHYPVALDNEMATWNAYHNSYWPGEYLIDQSGRVALTHFGEGDYAKMENAIRSLLSDKPSHTHDDEADLSRIGSPEMYLGAARIDRLASPEKPRRGKAVYSAPSVLPPSTFAFIGTWALSDEYAESADGPGSIALSFRSGKVFLVASSQKPVELTVIVDGKEQPPVTVQGDRLYTLFNSEDYDLHVLLLKIPQPGLRVFTFTFG